MNFLKWSLLKQFTVFSLLAFTITAVSLNIFIYNHIKNDKIKDISEITSLAIDALIKPDLSSDVLLEPFPEPMRQKMNQKFMQLQKSNNFIGMNLWNKKGNLVYSTHRLVENKIDNNNNVLMKALNSGKSGYKIIGITKGEDTVLDHKEVIKIYTPVVYNLDISGVFEVYIPYSKVTKHTTLLNRLISVIIFSGLLVLYLLLLKLIQIASRTLISQNQSLKEQKNSLEKVFTELNSSYKNTVATLSKAVDARDPYTAGHSERVASLSLKIGKAHGLSEERMETLEISALFHDIGKLGVPDNILLMPGKLNDHEFQKIKEHPSIGVNILKNIDFLKDALPIILHHHERYSGKGYPDGISGEAIPLEARIISVADAYDAMTSDRPYRKSLTHEEAINEIIKFKGIQFDPEIADSFLSINPERPVKYKYCNNATIPFPIDIPKQA